MKVYRWFCLLLLGFASCTSTTQSKRTVQTPKSTRVVQDYFPLRVGDERTYRMRYLSPRVLVHKHRILKRARGRFFDNLGETYRYDPWGLRGRRRYLLRYPLSIGTRWMSVVNFRVERYKIVSVTRSVSVPAGNYSNCIVVHASEDPTPSGYSHNRMFFAPRVGLIKIQTYRVLATGKKVLQNTMELVSFKPGPASTRSVTPRKPAVTPPSRRVPPAARAGVAP